MSHVGGQWWERFLRLGANLASLLRVRIDLVVVETEAFVAGVITELLLGVCALLLLMLALAFLGAGIVLVAGEACRLWAVAGVALGYLVGALGCLLVIRRRRRARGRWLAITRDELEADIEMLEDRS
jgi:hypothetical protein